MQVLLHSVKVIALFSLAVEVKQLIVGETYEANP
jgi:hypothetical protein